MAVLDVKYLSQETLMAVVKGTGPEANSPQSEANEWEVA